MSRGLKRAALAFLIGFAAAQLIRPDRTNPPSEANRTIRAHAGTSSGLAAVLDRSCRDCHSNDTVWPWYSQVAPASWLMAYGVKEGRKVVNFSEWSTYPTAQQRGLLDLSCISAKAGKMPGAYAWLKPETKLSPQDIETICAAARQAQADAGGSR